MRRRCRQPSGGHPPPRRRRRHPGTVRPALDAPAARVGQADSERLCRDALGDAGFDAAYAEGFELDLDAAVAYALRARGERKRPSTGWDSLTPTELEVVDQVAAGRSNPEIAETLLMSRATVKTHLSHIFTKLGLTNRAELAAQATRRTPS